MIRTREMVQKIKTINKMASKIGTFLATRNKPAIQVRVIRVAAALKAEVPTAAKTKKVIVAARNRPATQDREIQAVRRIRIGIPVKTAKQAAVINKNRQLISLTSRATRIMIAAVPA